MEQRYVNYFLSQQGGSMNDIGNLYKSKHLFQKGYGNSFTTIQHGYGIGNFFNGLYKLISPLLFSGLNAVKSEAVNLGKNVLNDYGSESIGKLLNKYGIESVENLKSKAESKIKQMSGKGIKRRRKAIKKENNVKFHQSEIKPSTVRNKKRKSQTYIKKIIKKKPRVLDIFD
jgi:hypothetical protein